MLHSSFIVQAVIIGTVFLRMEENTAAYFSRGGVLFLYVFNYLFPSRHSPHFLVAHSSSPPSVL